MHCPKCGFEDTKVVDTRLVKQQSVRRRRQCTQCNYRFSTVETIMRENILVLKRGGNKEPFSKDKIVSGILRAVEKRPIDMEQIQLLVASIEDRIDDESVPEVSTQKIGEWVMEGLKAMDPIAFIRFASVYKDFDELKDFQEVMDALEPAQTSP